jgi:hypothetical protein
MAIIASGSRYKRNTNYIIIVVCVLGALWLLNDGYLDKEFQQEHTKDGKPDGTLQFNRIYAPVACAIAVVYFLISAARLKSQKITADESGLHLPGKKVLAYNSINKIDQRFFDKEGHFTIEYQDGGADKQLKLSDRNYDNLGMLLDEVVRQSGAAPVEADQDNDAAGKI